MNEPEPNANTDRTGAGHSRAYLLFGPNLNFRSKVRTANPAHGAQGFSGGEEEAR